MNSINITGRITADTELKQTTSGISVCSFTVAVARPNVKSITDFIDCVAWRSTAEFVARYFRKGGAIAVTGILTTRKYETKDGKKRTAYEVLCSDVSFCSDKPATAPAESTDAEAPQFEELGGDGELPF